MTLPLAALREPVTAHRVAAISAILCGAALILLR
jgi:hypothetical protein